ncbi:MAG: hypothetical protein ABR544_05660 [Gammaproteobacteria bacterium]
MLIMLLILIMGSAYVLLTTLNKGDPRQPRLLATVQDINAVRDALIGYSITHGDCLPCPDSTGDGLAQATCVGATPAAGWLPWITLGLGAEDPWGRRLRYLVDPDFTDSGGGCGMTQSKPAAIRVRIRDAAGNLVVHIPETPAVVISHGPNGFGATSADGSALANPPAAHVDEETNRSATNDLVQRATSADSAIVGGPYDDLVTWVPLGGLKDQMARVNGGSLPP